MSHACVEVPPLSRKQIRSTAENVRRMLGINKPYFPIIEVIELVLPNLYPDFSFVIEDHIEMGNNHGLTYPEKKILILREDVYDRACEGKGRDRLTAAHEFSHLILHNNVPLARNTSSDSIPPFRSSEWQANCLAGELLVSSQHINICKNYIQATEVFGVSESAARLQWAAFEKDGLIKT